MGIFDKLRSLFSAPSGDQRAYWVYVQCEKCGEILKGRVDLYNDVSVRYGEGAGSTSYYCRKVFIGSKRCYQPIEVELTFDKNRKLVNQEITGGEFATEEDYQMQNAESEV